MWYLSFSVLHTHTHSIQHPASSIQHPHTPSITFTPWVGSEIRKLPDSCCEFLKRHNPRIFPPELTWSGSVIQLKILYLLIFKALQLLCPQCEIAKLFRAPVWAWTAAKPSGRMSRDMVLSMIPKHWLTCYPLWSLSIVLNQESRSPALWNSQVIKAASQ